MVGMKTEPKPNGFQQRPGTWTLPNQSTKATKVCRSVSKMVESEDC